MAFTQDVKGIDLFISLQEQPQIITLAKFLVWSYPVNKGVQSLSSHFNKLSAKAKFLCNVANNIPQETKKNILGSIFEQISQTTNGISIIMTFRHIGNNFIVHLWFINDKGILFSQQTLTIGIFHIPPYSSPSWNLHEKFKKNKRDNKAKHL